MSEEIRPNSHKYRESLNKETIKHETKTIVSNDAIVDRKKSRGKKMMKSVFNKDIEDIRDYLIYDVAIPAIKGVGMNTLSMIFYGEPLYDNIFGEGAKKKKTYDRASYHKYYKGSSSRSKRNRRREEDDDDVDYQEIVLKKREDAEKIVDEMRYRISEEGSVSIAEFLDMINIPGNRSDNDYGWDRERDIGVKKVRDGWLVDVSEAKWIAD